MSQPATYSPITDVTRAAIHLYGAAGSIAAALVYFGGAWMMLVQGDVCFLVVWLLFLGPIVAPLAGAFWPLLFAIDFPTP